ncbi:hypothetical protein AAFP30_27105 [Gordonia sp. CPCC 205515]|uniref:hypothetical protein n=1 Tax=Gordonia sp. CPCC 205515 TaxID=3140791 RepID=UPI003AF3B244
MTDGPAYRRPIPPREPQPPVWFEPPTRPLPIAQPIDLYQTHYAAAAVPRARRRVDLSVILAGIVMLLLAVGVVVGLATM